MKKKTSILLLLLILPFFFIFNIDDRLKNFDDKNLHFHIIDNLSKYINFNFSSSLQKEINFKKKSIYFEQFSNKFLRYRFYLTQTEKKIFLISKDGAIFYVPKGNLINKKEFIIKRIKTNLNKIIGKKYISENRSIIKGIEIVGDQIFVSFLANNNSCYSNAIAQGKLNMKHIEFSLLIKLDECKKIFNYSVGGNIVKFKENNLLLTTGDFQIPENLKDEFNDQNLKSDKLETDPQSTSSYYGKILSININTKKIKIISMGHRNPQGLFYDDSANIIFSTDHGPKGGDEINIDVQPTFKKIKNFGWPKSSYGVRYDEDINFKDQSCENKILTSLAPLCKSHKKFGYIEPAKYFTPSIGITQIIKIKNNNKNVHELIIASMGYHKHEDDMTIHKVDLDSFFGVINYEKYYVGERIRDVIQINDQYFFLALESAPAPSLGLVKFRN
tara:strand:+ start:3480 stop:4811 length:1332 start_codon:yes stop_codon:yes gene_type:complete